MKQFSIQEAISFGWKTFKKNSWVILGATLTVSIIPSVIQYILQLPFQNNSNPETYHPMMWIGTVVSTLLSLYLTIGLIKFYLKLVDGKKVEYQDIFDVKADEYVQYILGSILYGLIVLVGILLLVIPGIYLGIKYQYYSYLIIDKHFTVMDALKQSGEITKGNIWRLFLFGLAILGVTLLGLIILIVGVFVASPVVGIAQAFIFRKLSSKSAVKK